MISDQLKTLSRHLREHVPHNIADLYDGDIAAGEAQLAVEELVDALELEEIKIPHALADEIIALAKRLDVTRFTPEHVRSLIR